MSFKAHCSSPSNLFGSPDEVRAIKVLACAQCALFPLTWADDSEGCLLWHCKVLSTLGSCGLLWQSRVSCGQSLFAIHCVEYKGALKSKYDYIYPFCYNLGHYLSTFWMTCIHSELHLVMHISFCHFVISHVWFNELLVCMAWKYAWKYQLICRKLPA